MSRPLSAPQEAALALLQPSAALALLVCAFSCVPPGLARLARLQDARDAARARARLQRRRAEDRADAPGWQTTTHAPQALARVAVGAGAALRPRPAAAPPSEAGGEDEGGVVSEADGRDDEVGRTAGCCCLALPSARALAANSRRAQAGLRGLPLLLPLHSSALVLAQVVAPGRVAAGARTTAAAWGVVAAAVVAAAGTLVLSEADDASAGESEGDSSDSAELDVSGAGREAAQRRKAPAQRSRVSAAGLVLALARGLTAALLFFLWAALSLQLWGLDEEFG